MKLALLFVIMVCISPALAIDVNNCTLQTENDAGSTGSFMGRHSYYNAAADNFTSCAGLHMDYWTGWAATDGYNTSLNLNGYTWGSGTGDISCTNYCHGVEIYNGKINGNLFLQSSGEMTGIYLHDLYVNGSLEELYSDYMGQAYIENVYFRHSGGSSILGMHDLKMKNVTIDCYEGTCSFTSLCSYSICDFENVRFLGAWDSVSAVYDATIYLRNVTGFPVVDAGYPASIFAMEEGTFTAKDQLGNDIDAMAEAVSLAGDGIGLPNVLSRQFNPTKRKSIAISSGVGTDYYTKNATIWDYDGQKSFRNFDQYNVTVKSRNKEQSKIVTFSSPASAEFIFDFSGPKAHFWEWFVGLFRWW